MSFLGRVQMESLKIEISGLQQQQKDSFKEVVDLRLKLQKTAEETARLQQSLEEVSREMARYMERAGQLEAELHDRDLHIEKLSLEVCSMRRKLEDCAPLALAAVSPTPLPTLLRGASRAACAADCAQAPAILATPSKDAGLPDGDASPSSAASSCSSDDIAEASPSSAASSGSGDDVAEALLHQARADLANAEGYCGKSSQEALCAASELAQLLDETATGEDEEAGVLFRRALAGYESLFGDEHEDTLCAAHNLAVYLDNLEDEAGALALYRRVAAGRRRTLGPQDDSTLDCLFNLGALLARDEASEDEAVEVLREVQAGCVSLWGLTDIGTFSVTEVLFGLLLSRGESAEAMSLYDAVLNHGTSENFDVDVEESEGVAEEKRDVAFHVLPSVGTWLLPAKAQLQDTGDSAGVLVAPPAAPPAAAAPALRVLPLVGTWIQVVR